LIIHFDLPPALSGYPFGTVEFVVVNVILNGGTLLPTAPVACHLMIRAMAVGSRMIRLREAPDNADFVGQ
jgi:hypothetical protein